MDSRCVSDTKSPGFSITWITNEHNKYQWDGDVISVPFSTMVKALIRLKAVREDEKAAIVPQNAQKLEQQGNEQYGLRKDADAERHIHLVASFNPVLPHYRGVRIGKLENPDSDDFISVVNN